MWSSLALARGSPRPSSSRSKLGRGVMHIAYVESDHDEAKWKVERYSQHLACEYCNLSFETLNPHYSFNSPLGWCPTCEGLGVQRVARTKPAARGIPASR